MHVRALRHVGTGPPKSVQVTRLIGGAPRGTIAADDKVLRSGDGDTGKSEVGIVSAQAVKQLFFCWGGRCGAVADCRARSQHGLAALTLRLPELFEAAGGSFVAACAAKGNNLVLRASRVGAAGAAGAAELADNQVVC